ncbi:MAG: flagellar export protein FliJ [Alphaproteobacteria bacterium]
MKGLVTLIRYKKWNLDEKRRGLAEFERLERNLRAELVSLADELKAEQVVAQASSEGSYAYGEYAKAARQRGARIEESLSSVQQQADGMRDEVAEAFEELKRYELTQAKQERDARVEADRREQVELDEIAQNGYRRRRQA